MRVVSAEPLRSVSQLVTPYGRLIGIHPGRSADGVQPARLDGDAAAEHRVQALVIGKFGDFAGAQIIDRLNQGRLAAIADDFLLEEDIFDVTAGFLGEPGLDRRHILGRNMLDRIHAEAIDAHIQQFGEITGDGVLHGILAGVEILQPSQSAVLHFVGIGIISDVLDAGVEVRLGVAGRGEVAGGIVLAAGSPGA